MPVYRTLTNQCSMSVDSVLDSSRGRALQHRRTTDITGDGQKTLHFKNRASRPPVDVIFLCFHSLHRKKVCDDDSAMNVQMSTRKQSK
ncbi:hypothetical protein Pla100_63480 [Neorhodopirellula pilleata]|uniref:Uncharacterized protein n=1 Tax=Neorhodopirellula pilleata TaxID=2714738 RepID=A0A5C5YPH1_9BACT|nr:hypothetical protein Pla100_63480 [Neorhodopirellula pilleata]